jgi:hypothetical protein
MGMFKALGNILWPKNVARTTQDGRLIRKKIYKQKNVYESGTTHWKNTEFRVSAEKYHV